MPSGGLRLVPLGGIVAAVSQKTVEHLENAGALYMCVLLTQSPFTTHARGLVGDNRTCSVYKV